ncbi:MAG: hypothetical protein IJ039_00365 [Clostridia bacterium]|nr:hypothetical protein [Clostridia bacterium]
MTDIKRDFLYEFNNELRNIISNNSSIVSVFENIDNGSLKLSPTDFAVEDFLEEVGKCIFVIKKIISNPYVVVEGRQEIMPASQAKNANKDSVKLTIEDAALWSLNDGKVTPKNAYSVVSEDVFINYENAFIYQFIKLLIARLSSIKLTSLRSFGIDFSKDISSQLNDEQSSFYDTLCSYIKKLERLSKERIFSENSSRVIDLTNIFVTDTLASDKRYNYCYKFFGKLTKKQKFSKNVTSDFRVLYHNFALIKLLYNIYKLGYSVLDSNLHIAVTGKFFIESVIFDGEKRIEIKPTANGVNLSSSNNCVHIDFSKSMLKNAKEINSDYSERIVKYDSQNAFSKIYVAYLSAETNVLDGVLNIGYKDVDEQIAKLIKAL